MKYVIKIGDSYVTASGSLSPRQTDAIKLNTDGRVSVVADNAVLRMVKLSPRRSTGVA